MAHTTRPRKLAASIVPAPTGELPTTAATGRTGALDSALNRLWGLLTSMKFGLVLILAFAAFALVGTLLIQMPAGVADDPQARAGWLAGVRPKYGGRPSRRPGTARRARRHRRGGGRCPAQRFRSWTRGR